jgi:hypothetical protein
MKKYLIIILSLFLLTGCSEFALLSSGSSIALSNNVYAKAYSGVDLTTYLTTNKDIKTHAYEYVVKAKELKTLVTNTIMHDFEEPVIMHDFNGELAEVTKEIPKNTIIINTVIKNDVFEICYLSFFLAVSTVLLTLVLIYLFIYLFHCIRNPIKVVKKRKYKRRRK